LSKEALRLQVWQHHGNDDNPVNETIDDVLCRKPVLAIA
jgi:hypothetical protein